MRYYCSHDASEETPRKSLWTLCEHDEIYENKQVTEPFYKAFKLII